MMKKKTIVLVLAVFLSLLSVGCANDPAGESAADSFAVESSESVSFESENSKEASSLEESIVISLPAESSEESAEESEEEVDPLPVYRDDEEPKLETIVLPSIPETDFSFLQDELTILIGSNGVIAYAFEPLGATNQTLTWTSSNEKAVTVAADGTLTAVGLGVSYVRAETSKGNYAECRVEVVETLPYSPIAALIHNMTFGNPIGWQFSLYDVNMDGTKELLTRTLGEDGLPVVNILDTASGEILLSFVTGSEEEWAVWKRGDGSCLVLLSFSQPMGEGEVRYVVDELTVGVDAEGKQTLLLERVLMREAFASGSQYYARIDGEFVSCENSTYQSVRSEYFASIKQQEDTKASWTYGVDPEEIVTVLQNPPIDSE